MEDSVSSPPGSNVRFGKWKHLLNHIWVTEALNRPQIWCYMVCFLNHIFSILYECRLTCGAVYSLVISVVVRSKWTNAVWWMILTMVIETWHLPADTNISRKYHSYVNSQVKLPLEFNSVWLKLVQGAKEFMFFVAKYCLHIKPVMYFLSLVLWNLLVCQGKQFGIIIVFFCYNVGRTRCSSTILPIY